MSTWKTSPKSAIGSGPIRDQGSGIRILQVLFPFGILKRELQWGNCVSAITSTSDIDGELRARGHRLTPRRLTVVEVLVERTGHLTVDELLAGVQARYPSTNKTTVYRTLELLQSLGMVVVTDLGGGRLEYELARHPHHHLI